MSLQELFLKKTDGRNELKMKYNLPKRSKILIGIHLNDEKYTKKILKWLACLPANFIVFSDESTEVDAKNIVIIPKSSSIDMLWVDALVCNCENMKVENTMKVGVVPIINEYNYLGKILSEFHPGRWEGNAYLFWQEGYWDIYYALVRYLENYKFPYDNRNLVKNVVWV